MCLFACVQEWERKLAAQEAALSTATVELVKARRAMEDVQSHRKVHTDAAKASPLPTSAKGLDSNPASPPAVKWALMPVVPVGDGEMGARARGASPPKSGNAASVSQPDTPPRSHLGQSWKGKGVREGMFF